MVAEETSGHSSKRSSTTHDGPPVSGGMDSIAHQLASRVSEQLPGIIGQLIREGYDPDDIPWQLECSLTAANGQYHAAGSRFPIAVVNLAGNLGSLSPSASPFPLRYSTNNGWTVAASNLEQAMRDSSLGSAPVSGPRTGDNTPNRQPTLDHDRPSKRRKSVTSRPIAALEAPTTNLPQTSTIPQQGAGDETTVARRKKTFDNPAHQPSTLQKYISGVWESLYSGPRIDLTDVVEQWQALEADGQPKLLTDVEQEVATRSETGVCKC